MGPTRSMPGPTLPIAAAHAENEVMIVLSSRLRIIVERMNIKI